MEKGKTKVDALRKIFEKPVEKIEKPVEKIERPKEYIENLVEIHENTGKTFEIPLEKNDEEEKEESKIDFDSLRKKIERPQKKNIKLSENRVKKFESPKQYNDKGDQDKGKSHDEKLQENRHTGDLDKEKILEELEKLQEELEKLQEELDTGDLDKEKLQENRQKLHEIFEKLQDNRQKLQENFEKLREYHHKGDQEKSKSHEGKDGQKIVRTNSFYAAWKKEESRAVNVILDPATAHPALLLSEDGKRVTWQEPCQDLPSSSQRFVSLPCVMGQQGISSGKCHWEVEVWYTQSWDLGICRDDVKRKGRVTMSPGNGFWAIRLYDREYWALTSPETPLTLRERPLRVGIFLDYEAGKVSFCNMTDGSRIFTFPKSTFNGVLRPLFRLWSSGSGPLSIVHVEEK